MKTSTYFIAVAACASLRAGVFAAPCEKSYEDILETAATCKYVIENSPLQDYKAGEDCARYTNGINQKLFDSAKKCLAEVKVEFDDCEVDASTTSWLNYATNEVENFNKPEIICAPINATGCYDECAAAVGKISTSSATASLTQGSPAVGVIAGVAAYLAL